MSDRQSSTSPNRPAEEAKQVDLLVVGAGGAGMTAAMAARAAGLDTLLVEKSDRFGGSTALSGGGIWVPGAAAQARKGHRPDPADTLTYLKKITAGVVPEARLRAYVETGPRMLDFVERHTDVDLAWKPGYPDYFPEEEGGSAQGSVINLEPIDLRKLGADEDKLLRPAAVGPRGMWMRPLELKPFFTIRQSWRGKSILLRFLWRSIRARVTGERIATMGQALVAELWMGMRRLGVETWLGAPLQSLIVADDGAVVGAVVRRDGKDVEVRSRGGVVLATGGFEHDPEMRRRYQPFVPEDFSLGNPASTGDGIRAGLAAGAEVDLMDEAWWFPTLAWPNGRRHMMLNERMMPAQFIVNGDGERYINEATPYSEFGHAMIAGQAGGTTYLPSWLITDAHSWKHYVVAGHLPLPKIPFAPVPTGGEMVADWLAAGVVKQGRTWAELGAAIGVPAAALERTARRYNEVAATGHDDDFGRGDSAYDRFYGDETLPNPNLAPLSGPPYYAFRIVLGDLGTNGGLVTDEDARVLRADGSPIAGLYAAGNTSAAVMGRTYAGAGATIGPAMTFGFRAANHAAASLAAGAPVAAASAEDAGGEGAHLMAGETYDIVVLGSGAAGLSAALTARAAGASVGLFEKAPTVGGTTAVSGGVVWVPAHHRPDVPQPPTVEEALEYLRAQANEKMDEELVEVYVNGAEPTIEFIEEHSPVRFSVAAGFPDYRPELPGGRPEGGRSFNPSPFDFAELGAWADRVTAFPEDWSNVGFDAETRARMWGDAFDDLGPDSDVRVTGAALVGGMLRALLDAGVEPRTEHRAVRLLVEDDAVRGVALETPDGPVEVAARRGVVLATGGFEWDRELVKAFLRGPMHGPISPPNNVGDGLRMAMRVGAALGNMSEAWWTQIVKVPGDTYLGEERNRSVRLERSRPGSVVVNRYGRRFGNEAGDYNSFAGAFHHLDPARFEYPNLPAWMVFDQAHLDAYGFLGVEPGGEAPDWYNRSETIGELAAAVGIDPEGLAVTLAAWNENATAGVDPEFGRGEGAYDGYWGDTSKPTRAARTLGPIARGPFYAVPLDLGCAGTKGGPKTDRDARVLDLAGAPIEGLYAAGNAMAAPSGMAYGGAGGTIGPALVWGRRAAAHAVGAPIEVGR